MLNKRDLPRHLKSTTFHDWSGYLDWSEPNRNGETQAVLDNEYVVCVSLVNGTCETWRLGAPGTPRGYASLATALYALGVQAV